MARAQPSSFPRYLIAALACAISWQAGRLAYASWLAQAGAPAQVRRALELWPHHGAIHRALADLEPAKESQHLLHAAEWKPRAAEPLIALSLIDESRGDYSAALNRMERAAALDHGFRPVWAKLNLLARRTFSTGRDEPALWTTARQAFATSHRDRQSLMELCWSLRPDGSFLVNQLIGRRPPVLFDAVGFLMNQHQLAAAHTAFLLLLEQPYLSLGETNAGQVATADERRQRGLDLCDLQLHLRDASSAWQTWQALQKKGLLDSLPGRGFAWRRAEGETKGIEAASDHRAWQLHFTGDQADVVPLLWRYAPPLAPGRYRVALEPTPPPGLVFPPELVVRPGTPARVDLTYRRQPGTVPLRGTVQVGELRFTPLPEKEQRP